MKFWPKSKLSCCSSESERRTKAHSGLCGTILGEKRNCICAVCFPAPFFLLLLRFAFYGLVRPQTSDHKRDFTDVHELVVQF